MSFLRQRRHTSCDIRHQSNPLDHQVVARCLGHIADRVADELPGQVPPPPPEERGSARSPRGSADLRVKGHLKLISGGLET